MITIIPESAFLTKDVFWIPYGITNVTLSAQTHCLTRPIPGKFI